MVSRSRHRPSPNGGLSPPRWVSWDDLESEVGRTDAVVHLAGQPIADARWTEARLALARSSRVDSTARLAQAIAASAHKPRVWLSGSAVGVYGMRLDDEVLDELAPAASDVLAEIVVAWGGRRATKRKTRVFAWSIHAQGIVLGDGGALEEDAARIPFLRGRSDRERQTVDELDSHPRCRSCVDLRRRPCGRRGASEPGRARTGDDGTRSLTRWPNLWTGPRACECRSSRCVWPWATASRACCQRGNVRYPGGCSMLGLRSTFLGSTTPSGIWRRPRATDGSLSNR